MKKLSFYTFIVLAFLIIYAFKPVPYVSGEKIIEKMYKKYAGKWFNNVQFSQITENFKNDSLIKTTVWHENIVFPYHFRITFGDSSQGNAIIYKYDSSFLFRKGILVKKELRTDDIPFLIGGMYFLPLDTVKIKMIKEGFDITKAHESVWQGKKVFVIGSSTDDEKVSQLWIDKEKLVVVRFIKYLQEMKQEALLSNHKKIGKGWAETNVVFNLNDKLYQKEIYFNYKVNAAINMNIFDPYRFVK
jgi:hypothetical protein